MASNLLLVFVNKVNTELQSRMSNAFFFCGNLFLVTHRPCYDFFFITLLSELTVAKSLIAS